MKCGRIYTDPVFPLNFSHKYEKFLSTTTKPNQIFQPGVDAQSNAVDEAKNPKFARGGAEMPKNSSDVTLKCCWRESYNPERVFSTLPVTEMGLFTGLVVLALGRFIALHPWRIWAIFLWRNQRKGRQICKAKAGWRDVPNLLLLEGFSWLGLVALGGFQSQGSHVGLWDELGCSGSKRENQTGIFWGFGVPSWTLLSSSCMVCILQRIPIQFIPASMELQHFSSLSSWWKSSHLIREWRELLGLEGF